MAFLKVKKFNPFNSTKQNVVAPVTYEKEVQTEIRGVTKLKTTGTPSSTHWKDVGTGLPGGLYEAKYGVGWREQMRLKLGSGSGIICDVTRLMDRVIEEGNCIL